MLSSAPRLAIALTALNVLILASIWFRVGSAATTEQAPMLRGRSLELVDDQGRVRAELKVTPADPNIKMPDGTVGYPEAVLLRLIDSKNGPNVKLTTTEDGAGLVIGGESGYVQIISRGQHDPIVRLVTKDGRKQEIKVQ